MSYDRRATPGERSKVEHVTADNEAAARLATRCLVDAGHRRLAFATVAGMTVSRSDKIRGFLETAREAGVDAHARVLDGGPANEYGDAVIVDVGARWASRLRPIRRGRPASSRSTTCSRLA